MTIQEAQEAVDKWIKDYGVRYFNEMTNMAILTEEVGEVARIMARRFGEQSAKDGERLDLADELADVLWVLMCIANQTGVDLTEAFEKNILKKTSRDNQRHKNNVKLKS
ncbi:MAG: nucleotide pyrophosphohydrolase [Bacteroidales bacterium]|nr:nucleotide pyrophosphohydrolase [Bacteroidales bacterium]MDY4941757.1 nucleotide pyrophosphohydrolase [Candidatus Limisoma sp.]MDD7604085.1 nucleotide pyrophosphohydrolase [Bacteroidales bacterium]MDD7760219.1 nucleotide pyrophosphohydrolase [Bacteroidales bacterium]MDY5893161.1 nucleotide pyrophosphohydrolase [Candidatus Limisoma sp.]